jgi:hypothetical protein
MYPLSLLAFAGGGKMKPRERKEIPQRNAVYMRIPGD